MSYDLQIWSIYPIQMPEGLDDPDVWQQHGKCWVRIGKNWQIVVNRSDRILHEDIPEAVVPILPGIEYLTEINLEPATPTAKALNTLKCVSQTLAKLAFGVIVDPQRNTLTNARGIKRYQEQKREDRLAILELSWWFTDGPLLTQHGIGRFIELLERMLPEAIPKRYGLYEPPQHLYAEAGREHFIEFIRTHSGWIVWYPKRPVANVGLSIGGYGQLPNGFRANHVSLGIEASVLCLPGWSRQMRQFWREATKLLTPFYGDVRILEGNIPGRATYFCDNQTESHPVRGPWWAGLPPDLGQAAVIGEPYIGIWQEFASSAEIEDRLAFLSTHDWAMKQEVSALVGGVPERLRQKKRIRYVKAPGGGTITDWGMEHAEVWPFGNS